MASYRDLVLRFQADTTDLKKATGQAKTQTSQMATNISGSSKKGATGFKKGMGMIAGAAAKLAGPIAAVFAVDKIKDFGVQSVKMASDLNETLSKSQAIFGKNAKGMEAWSKTAATAFGLSQSEALAAAASFGDMFQQIGFTGKEAASSSKSVVQMAADLGSFNNLETSDVLDRISAAMRGEYDSLQAVIPNINAARVEKEALAATGKKNAAALTAEEKAQATLAIIQKDGAKAMGDFAKTSGGLANQQKILKAQFDNLKATLGQALLPIITKLVSLLNKALGPAVKAVGAGIQNLGKWFQQVKAGGGGASTTLTKIAESAKALWDAVSPIVKQITGKLFSQIKKNLPAIQKAIEPMMEALSGYFQMLASFYAKVAAVIKKVWSVIGPTVLKILGNIIDAIVGILSGLIKIISGILNIIVGIFTGDFGKIKKGVQQILQGVVKIVKSLLTMMFKNVRAVIEPMVKWVIRKITALKNKITKLLQAVLSWMKSTWKSGWAKIRQYFIEPIQQAFNGLKALIKKIRDAFSNFRTWAGTKWKAGWAKARDWITAPIKKGRDGAAKNLSGIKDRMASFRTWAGTKWKAGWSQVKDWMTNPIKNAVKGIKSMLGKGGLQAAFRGAVSAMGKIWGKLKGAILAPINKVIGFINTGLIRDGINKLLKAVGAEGAQLHWLKPIAYAGGGPVLGGNPMQRRGRDKYLSLLDHNEHVWTREEMRKFPGGHGAMLKWRKAVKQGKVYDYPAYAAGGRVRPVPGGFGTFPSYPGHTGVDFPVGRGTPVHAVVAGMIKAVRSLNYSYGNHVIQSMPNGMESVYAHLRNYIVKAGQNVGAGQVIGYVNSTGNSTGDHLHYTLQHPGGNYVNPTSFLNSGSLPGGTTGGSITGAITDMLGFLKGLSPVKWLTGIVNKLKTKITTTIGSSPWAKGLAQIPVFLAGKAKNFITDKLGFFGSGGGEPAGSGVERWRSTIVAALKANGLPTSSNYVEAWLRQVKSESGGNPKAVQNGYVDVNTISGDLAKGLLQTISATFNAYKHPGHGNIFSGFDNALAAINYAKSRYGAKGMLGVIGHGHGYDNGGYLPPGATLAINRTGRPEPVLTSRQWDAILAAADHGGQTIINIRVDGTVNDDRTIGKLITEIERYQRRRGPVQLARKT